MDFPSPNSPEEALTLALSLALTAPSNEKAKECSLMADSIAAFLDFETVERCKKRAKVITNV
tara:strand:+ start:2222 stop:2407 length:186 start_codon:yes stop_codon:yes gene_type:complete